MTAITLDAASATNADWVTELRRSKDRLTTIVAGLDEPALVGQSYDTEWTLAQVLSHLGSQAEIFGGYLDAALNGTDVPGADANQPIWDAWNAKGPVAMRDDSIAANEAFVSKLEALPQETADAFRLALFGMDLDLGGFIRMRLAELAVHTWDIAVALDPEATVAAEPVALLIDGLAMVATWTGKASPEPYTVRVETVDPARIFVVSVGDSVSLAPAEAEVPADGHLALGSEALLRLVYGRLDPEHTPAVTASGTHGLADLRAAFPGV